MNSEAGESYGQTMSDKPGGSNHDNVVYLEPSNGIMDDVDRAKAVPDIETQKTLQGNAHFHRLGWKRLTIVLIVEAVALGSLGLPKAFATLGMVAGVIVCVGIGLVALHASYILGQVKLKYPETAHYADIGRLMMGNFGYLFFGAIFVSQLTLVVGSHCLTGSIALRIITESNVCAIVFGVVSMVILGLLAVPPSFTEVAVLGYVDFASIILAIGVTMVATGIRSADQPGGLAASTWSAWPKEDLSFSEAFISVNTIVFAYAFAAAQPSFMDEMHTPEDYTKAVWALGIFEIVVYTLTGAIIYAFVGQEVQSPALLSAGPVVSRIVFGIALPVIFISGSINTTVVCRYMHGKIYEGSVVRFVNTKRGWTTWLGFVTAVTVASWLVAEAIPFFSELLSINASLFVSGFSFYWPPVMWYMLLREGEWYEQRNIKTALSNGFVFLVGITILVCGTYASVVELIHKFQQGAMNRPFSCSST